jgi:14-3-3 protein epsilon
MATDGSRESRVKMAKLAEQAERYEDMVEEMNAVVSMNADLSVEERNLLSVAYKNVVGSLRAAFRVVQNIQEKEQSTAGHEEQAEAVEGYLANISKELESISANILALIQDKLLPAAKGGDSEEGVEGQVFFHKMAADYNRYLAEIRTGDKRVKAAEAAHASYKDAWGLAEKALAPTHPIRLGLALNFSVFQYEIMDKPDDACALAKQAFDDAISELDTLSEESYKDSTLIMQLLRDNLTLWTTDDEEGKE